MRPESIMLSEPMDVEHALGNTEEPVKNTTASRKEEKEKGFILCKGANERIYTLTAIVVATTFHQYVNVRTLTCTSTIFHKTRMHNLF